MNCIVLISPVLLLALGMFSSDICASASDPPDWVRGFGSSEEFPQQHYFTGLGISRAFNEDSIGQAVDQAKNNAKSALAEAMKVRVQVKMANRTESNWGNRNSVKSKYSRDDYWATVISTSDIDIDGIGFKIYQQSPRRPVYALAWINKDRLKESYRQKLASRLRFAAELNKRMDTVGGQGDIIGARELALQAQTVLDEIDAIAAVLEMVGDSLDVAALATRKAEVFGRLIDADRPTGSLSFSLHTSKGDGNVTLLFGQSMVLSARVNKPCFLHLLCRLSVGVWILPGLRYWNLRLDESKIARDYVLPDSFYAKGPQGTDTLVAIVSDDQWPSCEFRRSIVAKEEYLAVSQSCIPLRALQIKYASDSNLVKRIPITTQR